MFSFTHAMVIDEGLTSSFAPWKLAPWSFDDLDDNHEFQRDVIVINLGHDSTATSVFQDYGLVDVFFPFDWCQSSFDGMYQSIQRDFKGFSDILIIHDSHDGYELWSKNYTLQFSYEFNDFMNTGFIPQHNYHQFKQKNDRRIRLFHKALDSNKKVYFFRTKITREEAIKLRDLITAQYPLLDYTLVAINDTADFQMPWHESKIKNFFLDNINMVTWKSILSDLALLNTQEPVSIKKKVIGILVRGESFRVGENNSRRVGTPESIKGQRQAAISLYENVIFVLHAMGYQTRIILDTYSNGNENELLSLYPGSELVVRPLEALQTVNLSNVVQDAIRNNPKVDFWFIIRFDMCLHGAFQGIVKRMIQEESRILFPWTMVGEYGAVLPSGRHSVAETMFWLPKYRVNDFLKALVVINKGNIGDLHAFLDGLVPCVGEEAVGYMVDAKSYDTNPAKQPNPYYSFVQRTDACVLQ